MSSQPVDLSKILTPALLQSVLDYTFPWKGPVDVKFASKLLMGGEPDTRPQVYDAVHFQALKPMSTLRPHIPDLTLYLPPASDPVYPERVAALILLVDQAPRLLYNRGTDIGWAYQYFDVITKQLVKTLLKRDEFPDATKDWTALGYSFEDAMFRKFLMYAPMIHSEDYKDHELVEGRLEKMRQEIEAYAGKRDPGRDTRKEDRENTVLFSKMITEEGGPPNTFAEFFFWVLRLYDVHYPIVKRYGRYPYRNEGYGRAYTEEENEFMERTKGFGRTRMTEDEVKTLERNVELGRWEELFDRRPDV